MSLIDNLLTNLAPHDCLGCGSEGSLLCNSCCGALVAIPDRCYRCRKVSPRSLTCHGCRKTSRLHRVMPATIYSGLAKELVWKLKFAGAQAAVRQMAHRMYPLIDKDILYLIVPVPTATSRIRRRGYDQAGLLAKELARLSEQRWLPCLRRVNQTHQVGARRTQRLAQLKGAFRVVHGQAITGANILLIDDVVTTGASLESAAATLRLAGAKRVEALVFAQP